jgi:hypothetical protein
MRGAGQRWIGLRQRIATFCGAILLGGCSWLPAEFNLSPLYRQRLDRDGTLLELDVLWPIVHYEKTAAGDDDFRVRPLWRRVVESKSALTGKPAVEHQFLSPLGRARSDDTESSARLFPLFWRRSRLDDLGKRESDWYFLFPLVWGGSREDGEENYFGVFPLFGDFPDFLTYCRFTFVLWPLYLRLEKEGRVGHTMLWPLIGFGHDSDGTTWHRFLPLWSFLDGPRGWSRSFLWPVISYGVENLDREHPIRRFLIWPLFGRQWSENVSAWTVLFPLFQGSRVGDRRHRLDILWPIFRREVRDEPGNELDQWWLFPLVARTITRDQWAWNFLWPLIWIRRYEDPTATMTQEFVIPVHYHTRIRGRDGRVADHRQIWPLFEIESEGDEHGATGGGFQLLAPWPWRRSNSFGVRESWDWAWTIARKRRHARDDVGFDLIANLYTTRARKGRTVGSVPWLFSWDSDETGTTLRLFQFLPLHFGSQPAEESAIK